MPLYQALRGLLLIF